MKLTIPVVAALFCALVVSVSASRSERKAQALADSGKPVAVKGATPITVAGEFNATFDAVVKMLQKADETVVLADRDAGMIATEIEITGKARQTGTRTIVTFIKEAEKETTVKVAVTVQTRYKVLQVEPWSDPKLAADLTAAAVAKFKAALGAN